jgi:hypothetical protein
MSLEFTDNSWLAMVREIFHSQAPEWELKSALYSDETRIYSEWISHEARVVVQIVAMASPEAAESNLRLFPGRIAPGATLDAPEPDRALQPDSELPDLGDESRGWTKSGEIGGTLIKFRIGNAIVEVEGSDTDTSVTLARLLAERLTTKT